MLMIFSLNYYILGFIFKIIINKYYFLKHTYLYAKMITTN